MSAADRIRRYIADELIGHPVAGGFDDETPLLNGLLDSGALMRLVAFLEEEFAIDIDDEDVVAEHFASVSAIDRLVGSTRGETGSS